MKKFVILFILFITIFQITKSNDLDSYFKIKSLSQLFPDNSFSMVNHNELNVSSINGNATFTLPISQYSMNGYPLNVTLNYSGSVSTTSYAYCDKKNGNWVKMHQNRPAWIVGVNGIAVQVYAGNAMFTCNPKYQMQEWKVNTTIHGFTLTNKDITWMIDGYDVCNELFPLGKDQSQDVIKILKSDGSILEFRNQYVRESSGDAWIDPIYYTGKYYINEVNSSAYAIVDFDWSQKNPAQEYLVEGGLYLGRFPLDTSKLKHFFPRILKYYPGDGYEYIFKEYKMPYGKRTYKSPDDDFLSWFNNYQTSGRNKTLGYCETDLPDTTQLGIGPLSYPSIFYLYEIKSSVKSLTKFNYSKHITPNVVKNYDNNTIDTLKDETIGRAALFGFDSHSLTYSLNVDFAYIKAFDKTYTLRFGKVTNDGHYTDSTDLHMNANGHFNTSRDLANLPLAEVSLNYSSELYYSSLGYITEITSDNLHYQFEYEDYYKLFTYCKFPITDSAEFKIELKNKRMTKFENYSKIYHLKYQPGYQRFLTNGLNIKTETNYEEASPYLNNYVQEVKEYSISGLDSLLIRTDNYGYRPPLSPQDKSVIITNIHITDHKTNKERSIEKHFMSERIEPILYYGNLKNPSPNVSHSYLIHSIDSMDNEKTKQRKIYDTCLNSKYLINEKIDTSWVLGNTGNDLIKNIIRKNYDFGTIAPDKIIFENDSLNNKFGYLLKSDTTRVYYSNDTLHSLTVNNYRNFLKDSLETIIVEKIIDKFKTRAVIDSLIKAKDEFLNYKDLDTLWCYYIMLPKIQTIK